jgi:hypothetical protein
MKAFCIALLPTLTLPSFAQDEPARDSIPPKSLVSAEDTFSVKKTTTPGQKPHSVKKAVFYSAVVPGWGQVYNKKWWKVPIIYAGFGGLGFAIGWNAKRWRTYSDAYRIRVDGDTTTIDEFEGVYSDANLVTLKNYYRRNMDLSIIFTSVLYALNIIDAAVDAHLFEYDISDDLTLRVQPQLHLAKNRGSSFAGINLTMRFR